MRRCALAVALVLLGVVSASAQTTGSIGGTVTDNTGAVLPGATVTATSPAMMGVQTAVTNAQGQYRFPSLPPGTYALKFELPSFATVNREGIIIGIAFTATVNTQLALASLSEMVTVTGESPVVDVKNTNVQTNISLQSLQDMPHARDIWSVIGQAPGFMVTSFDVGGSRAGTQTGYSAFGYSGQVRVTIDGVNTTEGTGGAGFYYDYGSFEEIQLGSDGNDASAATPGVQLNAILRSGGNILKGEMYYDYENKSLQSDNMTDRLRRLGGGAGTRILAYRDPNGSIGGPIKKDKLWYFVALRDQRTGVTVNGFPVSAPSNFEFETRLTNWSYKVTYQLSKNNRLGHYIQYGRKFQPHRGAGATAHSDTPQRQDSWSWAVNAEWNSVVSSRFFFNTRFANFGYDWPDYAYNLVGDYEKTPSDRRNGPLFTSSMTGMRNRMSDSAYGNTAGAFNPRETNRDRNQFDLTGTLFQDNFLKGSHAFKFGVVSEWEMLESPDYGFLDNISLTFNSTAVGGVAQPEFSVAQRVVIRNTPRRSADASWHHGAYLNDQWTVTTGLTMNVGVRMDYYSSYYPTQPIWDGPYRNFFYAGAPLENGYSIPATPFAGAFEIPGAGGFAQHTSVAPRVGLAWDPLGKGKTVVKANWGRFYHNTGTASGGVNPNQSITYTFNWTDRNGDKRFTPGLTPSELGTFVSNAGGTTDQIDPNIKHSFTDSMSVWVEHELFRNIGTRIGYTFRKDKDLSQNVQLARLYGMYTSTVTAPDPGVDGTLGTPDDGPPIVIFDIPLSVANPLPVSRTEERTVDSLFQIDRAFDITLTKRMANKWSLTTNFLYNWDHDRGNPQNPNAERFNDNEVTTWAFKAVGTYQAPWGLVISPSVRHQAGDPLARNVSVASGIDEFGVQRNIRIGTQTFQAERSGAYRENNVTLFDTRFEKRFRYHRNTLGVFIDLYNLTNTNASQSADSTVGRNNVTLSTGEVVNYQRFLRPTGILPARVVRFGTRLTF